MMTWSSDPNLITADCDAEDRFVYTFVDLLAGRAEHAVPSWRALGLAQMLLDVAGACGRVPADLLHGEVAQVCGSAGLAPALGEAVAALIGGHYDTESCPRIARPRVAGARGRVPADLIDGEVAQVCRSVGLAPALGEAVAASVGDDHASECCPPLARPRGVPEASALIEPHLAAA